MKIGAALAALLLTGCGGPLRRADRLLDRAERVLEAPAPKCTPRGAIKLAAESQDVLNKVRWDLERHYNCLAFARRDPGVCDDLAAARLSITREEGVPPVSFELLCKTIYYEALMAEDVIGERGRIKELCISRNLIGDRDFKLDSLDVSCGIIEKHAGDTAATCGLLDPYFDNASIAKTCPKMLRFVSGDETVCPLLPDPMVNERCHGYVALKKGDCGGSVFCRQVKGAGEELCEPTGRAVAEGACSLLPRPSPEAFLAEAEEELRKTQAPWREHDARLERLARLRLRWRP